jgi:hypothetical protein
MVLCTTGVRLPIGLRISSRDEEQAVSRPAIDKTSKTVFFIDKGMGI